MVSIVLFPIITSYKKAVCYVLSFATWQVVLCRLTSLARSLTRFRFMHVHYKRASKQASEWRWLPRSLVLVVIKTAS